MFKMSSVINNYMSKPFHPIFPNVGQHIGSDHLEGETDGIFELIQVLRGKFEGLIFDKTPKVKVKQFFS